MENVVEIRFNNVWSVHVFFISNKYNHKPLSCGSSLTFINQGIQETCLSIECLDDDVES